MTVIWSKAVRCSWSTAITLTVVRIVAVRCDNPVLPTQFAKIHIEFFLATLAMHRTRTVKSTSAYTFHSIRIGINDQKWSMWIIYIVRIWTRRKFSRFYFGATEEYKIQSSRKKVNSHFRMKSKRLPHSMYVPRSFELVADDDWDGLSLNKWILTWSPQPEQSISNRKRDLAPSAYHWRTDVVTSSFCHPSFVNCTFLVALISVLWFSSYTFDSFCRKMGKKLNLITMNNNYLCRMVDPFIYTTKNMWHALSTIQTDSNSI